MSDAIAGPLNHESIDKKGWAFLLPTVTDEDAKRHFPDHHSCEVCPEADYKANMRLLNSLLAGTTTHHDFLHQKQS